MMDDQESLFKSLIQNRKGDLIIIQFFGVMFILFGSALGFLWYWVTEKLINYEKKIAILETIVETLKT